MRTGTMWFRMAGQLDTSRMVDVRVPAAAASAREVRHLIGGLCACHDVGRGRAADVALAVSEAVTNAIVHAYPGVRGDIDVHADLCDGELVVVVRDYGVGVGPEPHDPRRGAGLEIMSRLADGCELHRAHPGLCVRLRFRVDG